MTSTEYAGLSVQTPWFPVLGTRYSALGYPSSRHPVIPLQHHHRHLGPHAEPEAEAEADALVDVQIAVLVLVHAGREAFGLPTQDGTTHARPIDLAAVRVATEHQVAALTLKQF